MFVNARSLSDSGNTLFRILQQMQRVFA
jgi:hypothetical protein